MAEPQAGADPERPLPSVLAQILGAAIADDLGARHQHQPQGQPEPEPEGHLFDRVSRIARADSRVTDRAYRVLATIEGFSWGNSRVCTATNRTIGRESGGVGPNTVRKAIRLLEELGYLRVEVDPTRMRGQRLLLLFTYRKPADPLLDDE